jgi:TetR/AcrR family transcriptional regulator, cholesterol catabolism regulator
VHLDELDEPRPVLVGQRVARLDLAAGVQVVEEFGFRDCRTSGRVDLPIGRLAQSMTARRDEVTRAAARLFADRGYHGTSLADLAEALGIQKASLYHHIEAKEELLWEIARAGAAAFGAALDGVPEGRPATERIRLALRAHLGVVADQLDTATVFTREWRALEGEHRERFLADRRRYEERVRDLFREGVERGELRADLDVATAALLFLSAANWAYTWLRPGAGTDAIADRCFAVLLDGMRGYATPG